MFLLAVVLLAGSAFFLCWAWTALPAATAFQAGTICPAAAPTTADCRVVGTDTVQTVSGYLQPPGGARNGDTFTVDLRGHGRVPGGSIAGAAAHGSSARPKVGSTMTVVGWQGHLLSASAAGFTAREPENPVHDLAVVYFCALVLLLAGLGVTLLSLGPGGHRSRGRLRRARRTGLVLVLGGLAMLTLGDEEYAVGAATLGALFIAAWCGSAGRAVFSDAIRTAEQHGPLPTTLSGVRAARQAARPRSDGCPVPPGQQEWIERSVLWLTTQFGYDPVHNPVVLPTPAFFPQPYAGTDDDIRALVRTVCPRMGVDPGRVTVRLVGEPSRDPEAYRYVVHSERFAAGVYEAGPDGAPVVELDRAVARSRDRMTAVIAHELGHARLIGEGRVDPVREDHEPLTDLTAVFFGFGIFAANAGRVATRTASSSSFAKLGYLDQRMFGYSLACYARLRQTPDLKWAQYLNPLPHEYLEAGSAYLHKLAPYGGFPTQQA